MTDTLLPSADTIEAFSLVLARTSSWTVTAPLVGVVGIPGVGRLAVAVALAVFFTPLTTLQHHDLGAVDLATLLAAQVLFGLALGWLTSLWLSAAEVAGTLVDFQSGFSTGALLDPVSGAQSSAFSRLASTSAIAILFASGGYGAVLEGLGRSFRAVPVDTVPRVVGGAAAMVAHVVTGTMLAALEIAAPLLGVLFLTEVVVAVASRLAPAASPMAYSMSIKSLVALTAGGSLLVALPTKLDALTHAAVQLGGQVLR